MFRKKGFWIVLVLILLAASGGGYYYTKVYAGEEEPETETVNTATVRQGEIVISANGSGTVIAASEVDLGFQTGGLMTELLVDVGDQVQEGDVLARLDDIDAQKTLVSAELQLVQAQDVTTRVCTEA